jgi:hypothetical protein
MSSLYLLVVGSFNAVTNPLQFAEDDRDLQSLLLRLFLDGLHAHVNISHDAGELVDTVGERVDELNRENGVVDRQGELPSGGKAAAGVSLLRAVNV